MATKSTFEKFKALASKTESSWLAEAKVRQDQDEEWKDFSLEVCLLIIQTLRAKNMSQKDLADRLGVTPQNINKILRGKENLSIETIIKIGKALGVRLIRVGEQEAFFVMRVTGATTTFDVAVKGVKAEPSYPSLTRTNLFVAGEALVQSTDDLVMCNQ